MKQFKKIPAWMTVLAICSTMNLIPVSAEKSADLPDWIPQNFAQAMNFENQYGKTHIKDGLICCVQEKSTYYAYSYETQDAGGSLDDLAETVLHETYTFSLPEKPDESDTEAYEEYHRQLEELGIYSYEPSPEECEDIGFYYEVTVYKPTVPGTIDLNWLAFQKDQLYKTTNLTFEITPDGEITETDLYGWIPDSPSECWDLQKPTVCGKYIISCDIKNFDGGYSTSLEQNGTGEVEEFLTYYVSKTEPFVLDTPWYHVNVYQPVTPGTVQITWNKKSSWDEAYLNQIVKNYQIDEDGTIHEIEPVSIMGDVNHDGEFSVLDVVLFQKWLLGDSDIHLDNWEAADFNQDGKLNIFDLLLMKHELIQKNQEQIPYSIEKVTGAIRGASVNEHEEAQAYIAYSSDELRKIVESAENVELEQTFIPGDLEETIFEDKAVIVMYTTAASSDTYTIIDNIEKQQDKLIIFSTTRTPDCPVPDMAYSRYILTVDLADVQGITSAEVEDVRTYDSGDEEDYPYEWFKDWLNSK